MPEARRRRVPKQPLSCHDRALGLIAVRPRSRRELETRLVRAGFEPEEVQAELVRLEEVGLLDDERFAEDFAERALVRGLKGRRAVAGSLAAKGVARATIDRVLDEAGGDESARASELARSRAPRLRSLPPETAYRRLVSALLRRGYDGAVARRAAAEALRVDAVAEE